MCKFIYSFIYFWIAAIIYFLSDLLSFCQFQSGVTCKSVASKKACTNTISSLWLTEYSYGLSANKTYQEIPMQQKSNEKYFKYLLWLFPHYYGITGEWVEKNRLNLN